MKYPPMFAPELEGADPQELQAMQDLALREQVTYVAARSPFYRRKLAAAGVDPERFRGLADLVRLPFTEKEELREALDRTPPMLGENQTASQEEIVRIHASSGTTGKPTYVGLTRQDADYWARSIARAFWCAGIRPNDIVIHAWNYSLFVGGLANHLGGELAGATMVPMGVGQSARLLRTARDLGATAMTGTPSYVKYLAVVVERELGIHPAELGFRRFVVGGEPGGGVPGVRDALEETWRAQVREVYGSVDIHPIVGAECDQKDGMHFLVPDLVIPELLGSDGTPIPFEPGVEGEIVYTAIRRQATPVLRWRSRDVIRVTGVGRCQCGRTGYRFRVMGRTDDMLIVRGVNVYPSAVESVLKQDPRLTGEFAILLRQPGPQEYLEVVAEYRPEVLADQVVQLAEETSRRIKSVLLVSVRLRLVSTGVLPTTEHKAKRVYKLYAGEQLPISEKEDDLG